MFFQNYTPGHMTIFLSSFSISYTVPFMMLEDLLPPVIVIGGKQAASFPN